MVESSSQVAEAGTGQTVPRAAPTAVVEGFLGLLVAGDIDGAVELLAVDVRYQNVGLPTVNGRERVRRLFRTAMRQPGAGFEAYVHTISAAGASVLTERTDVLRVGRLRIQLWVCGRFDVQDGQIVLWRDYFDFANFTIALLRGLLATIIPALAAKPPATT
ncbi:MAG: limonene-1,2-epoxide hydrolase family protein [Solirubrobacteraceae bacterium]